MRMLSPALGRHGSHRALQNLEQPLLHAFSAHIPGDGHVFAFAGNLVNFINIDDAALCPFDVSVRRLNQAQQHGFHIVPHIAGFRHAGRVCNGKGNVQDSRQRLGKIGLAASGRPDHQDVALLQLNIVILLRFPVDPLIMIVHRHAHGAFGPLLPDDILIQHLFHIGRQRQLNLRRLPGLLRLLPGLLGTVQLLAVSHGDRFSDSFLFPVSHGDRFPDSLLS